MAISSVLGSSALLPAGLGFRNKIINGDFGINQRAFASTVNPANVYCFDRWNMYSNNGTSTYSPQTFTPGNTIAGQEPSQYLRVVSSGQTTANAATLVAQKIEDVRTCAGQPITISFWAKCGTAGKKIAVEIAQDFGTGGSPSSAVVTHVNQVTLTTSWVRYTLNIVAPSISGKTLGTTANTSSLALGFWFSAGTDFSTRTNSLGIQSDTFEIWGVQLEQNYQPTPFEQRPIGAELALCQRYYYLFGNGDLEFIASTSVNYVANFPIFEMRATPTVTQTTYSTTNAYSNPTIVAMSRRSIRLVFVPISNSYARCIALGETKLDAEL